MSTVNKEYIVLLASGTRTANINTDDVTSAHGVGAIVVVDVGSITAGALTVTIQGKDRISSKYYDILSSAAILSPQTKILTVYPGIAASNNVSASNVLPYDWRVSITAASGTADYSVGATVLD